MKPIGSNVIIRQDDEVKKIGMIIVPDNHTRAKLSGVVQSVGLDVKEVGVGDWVMFSALNFEYLDKDPNNTILLIPESSILCKSVK